MKLSQIFEQLTAGELRQMAISGAESGDGVLEKDFRTLTNHVVLGLTALYTRFNLKENSLIVQLQSDRFTYPLQSKYAVNGKFTVEPIRYIIDTVSAPFLDDILKVERVIAVDSNVELPLNDYNEIYSVVTPAMDTIRVPAEIVMPTTNLDPQLQTSSLKVVYRANHPNILPRAGYLDPELTNVELPMSHLQALLYFVASRVTNPVGMVNEFNAGNNWYAKYEMECKRLENEGVEIDISSQVSRARRNGWV